MNWIKRLFRRITLDQRIEDLLYEAQIQHLLHREHAAETQAMADMYEQRAIRLASQKASRDARA